MISKKYITFHTASYTFTQPRVEIQNQFVENKKAAPICRWALFLLRTVLNREESNLQSVYKCRPIASVYLLFSISLFRIDLLWPKCSKEFFILRMCDFIVDIKESQCKKRFCFLRWLLPLLSPISCIPIMFSNYLLMW